MKLRQLTTLGPVSIYKCTKTLCADCGKPIAPDSVDGICSVCRIKRRTKKRQEEAAARAKERAAEREAKRAAEEAAKTAAEESAKAAAQELAAENAAASAETAVPAAPGSGPGGRRPHRQHLIAGMQNRPQCGKKTIDAGANQCYTLANHLCGRRTVTKE